MSIRLKDLLVLVAGFTAGAAVAPGTVSGEAGRLLAIFLGLVSASLLPTITLLVNSMTGNGRSVHSIERLERELQSAMDALFLLFGLVAVAVGALVALAIPSPPQLRAIPYLTTDFLPRTGQGIVCASTTMIIWRAGQIPAILRRSLEIRREIAVEEARRKLFDLAPNGESVRESFRTHSDFGQVVSLQDLQRSDRPKPSSSPRSRRATAKKGPG